MENAKPYRVPERAGKVEERCAFAPVSSNGLGCLVYQRTAGAQCLCSSICRFGFAAGRDYLQQSREVNQAPLHEHPIGEALVLQKLGPAGSFVHAPLDARPFAGR
jgi:hypothetical protein